MPEAAFFAPEGDRYRASELTRGPWDHELQHAGPPTALLGRALERCEPRPAAQIARVTFEILRPIPISTLVDAGPRGEAGPQRRAARG